MKTIFKTIFVVMFAYLLASCEENELDDTTPKCFGGSIVVTNADNTLFTDPDIHVTFMVSDSVQGCYDIILKQVKFAERMPVRIDMTIPSVSKNADGDISGDNIVPWALGGPYDRYTIYDLSGRITYDANGEPSELLLDMICGSYPMTYRGVYTEE